MQWLPNRVTKDSIVFFYFVGQAVVDPGNGDVFLLPYEGSPSSARRRLFALHDLQRALMKLKAELCLLLIEAPVHKLQTPSSTSNTKKVTGPKVPNWWGALNAAAKGKQTRLIQIVRDSEKSRQAGSLLDGLQGKADANRDGRITVRELLGYLRGPVIIMPSIRHNSSVADIPLAGEAAASADVRRPTHR